MHLPQVPAGTTTAGLAGMLAGRTSSSIVRLRGAAFLPRRLCRGMSPGTSGRDPGCTGANDRRLAGVYPAADGAATAVQIGVFQAAPDTELTLQDANPDEETPRTATLKKGRLTILIGSPTPATG